MLQQPPSPAYIHTLTSTFAATLDEIPQDMCRHFADLRELDAVLSQSLSGITKRIEELTQRIEGGLASLDTLTAMPAGHRDDTLESPSSPDATSVGDKEIISNFQLLHQIADDTGRIKLGGEDKIRVASLAAEHMNAYYQHLLTLVRRMYEMDAAYDPGILSPYTAYPHVPPSALVDPTPENRRGGTRRTVAVQNNSYGLQYAPMSAQGQNGAYQSSHRNESASRGANGETPSSKRRRVQPPNVSANVHHHSQLQGPRADRDMDTDDYSTPRRGVSALDAEAYRPGGNTGNRARTQGRKGRDGRPTSQNPMLDINGMPFPMDVTVHSRSGGEMGPSHISGHVQGPESITANHGQTNGVSSHKSHSQNGRSKTIGSQHHRQNPNPQPQQYPVHYQAYGGRGPISGNQFGDPSIGPYEMAAGAYPAAANLNPLMDANAYHHHSAMNMNMNPNLNHLPPNAGFANPVGMGMVIPASLPPPPGTTHGRPSSANMTTRNTYDAPPPRSSGGPRQSGYDGGAGSGPSMSSSHGNPTSKTNSTRMAENSISRENPQERDFNMQGNGSSASGGLMPLPMMTSLPPAGVLTHPSHAPHPSYVDPSLSRGRGYSSAQSYPGPSYNASDEPNTLSAPSTHHPHTSYQPPHSSSLPPSHKSQSGYINNPLSSAAALEKVPAKADVYPSLLASSLTKDPLSSNLHARAPSIPVGGSGNPGALNSTSTRNSPSWNDHTIPVERPDREEKPPIPYRARSGTIDGSVPTGAISGTLPKYREQPPEQRTAPAYERISPSFDQRDRDREMISDGNRPLHPTPVTAPPLGGLKPPEHSAQGFSQVPSQNSPIGPNERIDVVDKFEGPEREGISNATGMRHPSTFDRPMNEHEAEVDQRRIEAGNLEVTALQDDSGAPSRDDQGKAIRTPNRRKTGEEGSFASRFGDGGDMVEGQTADDDSKTYCICGGPSFGQMIGCDDSECEYEWFHLACLGITGTPPQGDFVCPTCKNRRAKGSRKTSKKKTSTAGRGRGI